MGRGDRLLLWLLGRVRHGRADEPARAAAAHAAPPVSRRLPGRSGAVLVPRDAGGLDGGGGGRLAGFVPCGGLDRRGSTAQDHRSLRAVQASVYRRPGQGDGRVPALRRYSHLDRPPRPDRRRPYLGARGHQAYADLRPVHVLHRPWERLVERDFYRPRVGARRELDGGETVHDDNRDRGVGRYGGRGDLVRAAPVEGGAQTLVDEKSSPPFVCTQRSRPTHPNNTKLTVPEATTSSPFLACTSKS